MQQQHAPGVVSDDLSRIGDEQIPEHLSPDPRANINGPDGWEDDPVVAFLTNPAAVAAARAENAKLVDEALSGTGRYTPNTFAWPVGSLVLHVADGKETDCLLRVVSKSKPCQYTGEAQLRMQYEFPERLPRCFGGKSGKRYIIGTLGKLLDPAKFGVQVQQLAHVRAALEGGAK